jgi:MFS family permease
VILADIGYYELLKSNSKFRKFWFAAVISMFGEWFNTIALFTLIIIHTGSEELLGILITVRMFGFAIMQPIIGLLADRWSRKWIMIASNIIQIPLALTFILVNGPEDIYWLIGISGLMAFLHSVYMTAERAALPNIVSEEELTTANALDAASWSTALAIGAALGGLVVSKYGVDVAFVIDSVTFLISTIILLPIIIPQTVSKEMQGPLFSTAFFNIKAGFKRIFSESRVMRIIFAKSTWNIAGGGLSAVFLVLAGAKLSPTQIASGIGLFFMARGIGTGVGPIIARKYFTNEEKWSGLIGILVAISGLFYLFVGLTIYINLWLTVLLVVIAHAASGANWVLSTILTQKWVEDEMRGRVFSMDMLLMALAFSISTYFAGWLLENGILDIRLGMITFSLGMILAGIIFTIWQPQKTSIS